jgi:hypothetical protein
MLTMSGTPARRAKGSPSCHASSHTVMPTSVSRTEARTASVPGTKYRRSSNTPKFGSSILW